MFCSEYVGSFGPAPHTTEMEDEMLIQMVFACLLGVLLAALLLEVLRRGIAWAWGCSKKWLIIGTVVGTVAAALLAWFLKKRNN